MKTWRHPGGKNRTAEQIAREVLGTFGSFEGMAREPLERFLEFKGLGDVKILRVAAAFEIARRLAART